MKSSTLSLLKRKLKTSGRRRFHKSSKCKALFGASGQGGGGGGEDGEGVNAPPPASFMSSSSSPSRLAEKRRLKCFWFENFLFFICIVRACLFRARRKDIKFKVSWGQNKFSVLCSCSNVTCAGQDNNRKGPVAKPAAPAALAPPPLRHMKFGLLGLFSRE